jgi:hypothetical protein
LIFFSFFNYKIIQYFKNSCSKHYGNHLGTP